MTEQQGDPLSWVDDALKESELKKPKRNHNLSGGEYLARRKVVWDWLDVGSHAPGKPSPRMPLQQLRKEYHITRPQFYQMKDEWKAEKAHETETRLEIARQKQAAILCGDATEEEIDADPVLWWKKRRQEIDKAILDSAKKGNAQSQKLAKQLAGELVEKQEIRIGLTADELTRRNLEAERQLREAGFNIRRDDGHRMAQVQDESSLLPGQVCLDSESQHGQHS